MEQILAFVLGVSAVAFLWVVVVAFNTANKVKSMESALEGIYHVVERNDEHIARDVKSTLLPTPPLIYPFSHASAWRSIIYKNCE